MRVIREHLIRHRIDVFVRLVLGNIQLDEVRCFERGSVDGIRAVFFDPWEDYCEVEDCPGCGADGVGEGLEGERAEVEGKAFEWRISPAFSCS